MEENKDEQNDKSNDIITWKHYNIKKRAIGNGSFSKVYKAIDTDTNQYVAIKKINFFDFSDSIKKRIHNELFILQSLNHKNIVKFIDFEYVNNNLFIIFEYCDGDISEYIGKIKNEQELKQLFKGVIDGISYLHSKNIIHRDIKPQNILIKDGEPKICDFGFSAMIKDEFYLNNTICGTPLYMSPEVLNYRPYNMKSDIWSLGILFFFIAYGYHPFNPKSIDEYKRMLNHQIKYPSNFSWEFIELLHNMLSIDYIHRYNIIDVVNHKWLGEPRKEEMIFDMEIPEIAKESGWKCYKGVYRDDYFSPNIEPCGKSMSVILIKKDKQDTGSLKEYFFNSYEFLKKKINSYSL
jgi:serine/threonine-protein kinase ULK/ATG1